MTTKQGHSSALYRNLNTMHMSSDHTGTTRTGHQNRPAGQPVPASLASSFRYPLTIIFSLLSFVTAIIWLYFQNSILIISEGQQPLIPDECRYLNHLHLGSSAYQAVTSERMACMSPVRYFGQQKQHSIRYTALGSINEVDEMRLTLQLGEKEPRKALGELTRFGNSLALPLTGRALPFEIIQSLKQKRPGVWKLAEHQIEITFRALSHEIQQLEIIIRK